MHIVVHVVQSSIYILDLETCGNGREIVVFVEVELRFGTVALASNNWANAA